MISQARGVIRNGRVETDGLIDLPEGTAVVIAPDSADDDGPVAPREIARVLAAMQSLLPLDIPPEVAADLDSWERKLKQRGIDCDADGAGDEFR